ncbi:hypothetical protein, variant 3 [Phialophora macrospora]|uniref:AMP-activated protein kinase glycogen-binding domain-containing protein n=1 Tax=Phialophora macrospora TaxID=1851006 RepID=A0A0D2FWK3_9EURO|nr:hypothetical protein PV04_01014 [Phialophora macrospora]KIW72848.1 hypothetical protein, variant 1 [Phialophora macrospora]KIW72849.1 hypothetical protein, variant 2 [Phialophora macrospora]KIW72850.1 hypothetical protein, variant 3 [Phialophora macrospora]
MVSTTIIFKKDNVQPPVFVAGGFTDWAPVEMAYETTESNGSVENVFSHKIELEPGEYQYKFRLGPGDWWVLDESAQKATDQLGNVNNLLSIEAEERKPSSEPPIETIPTPPAHALNTKEAPIIDDEPKLNGFAVHEQSAQTYPPTEEAVPKPVDSHTPQQSTVDSEEPRAETDKQVQSDEKTGEVSSETATPRKNSIPDFAPPPYSVSVSGTVPDPNEKVQVAPVAEAAPQKQPPSKPAAIKDELERKKQSLVARVCSAKSLAMVVVMVAVPVAVSYYLRR